jgi:hypothetical protein
MLSLSSYDVILGKQWLSKYDPIISHKTNEITFQFQNQNVTIQADLERHKALVSASTFSRVIRRGYKTFALLLKPEEPSILPNTPAPPVQSILDEFADVFPKDLPKGLPPQRSHDFKIELQPDALPIQKGLYRLSAKETEKLKKQLNDLLEKGFIQPSSSPWGAPILFVNKKDGGFRLCVYYGYHQIRLDRNAIPKTAFLTRYGLFEFTVLPFGLTNAPSTFMAIMNDVFHTHLDRFVIIYLDDILIYSITLEEHLVHLCKILELLRRHTLYAKMSKCAFCLPKVEYLGHLLSDIGISVENAKVDTIRE